MEKVLSEMRTESHAADADPLGAVGAPVKHADSRFAGAIVGDIAGCTVIRGAGSNCGGSRVWTVDGKASWLMRGGGR